MLKVISKNMTMELTEKSSRIVMGISPVSQEIRVPENMSEVWDSYYKSD